MDRWTFGRMDGQMEKLIISPLLFSSPEPKAQDELL